ncbi:MAG: response regulator transcription factor [Candidatus Acidiferrales bacterium]
MSYTVLIVDDNPYVRVALRDQLERNTPWRACGQAENGRVAVEKVKALRPDVVILDLQMPVMNGLEAVREIRAVAPSTEMIMFTMHNTEQLLKDARAAGIRNVVSKSVATGEHLLAVLRKLDRRRQRPDPIGNRHRGSGHPLSPATPPYMRVRVRRFRRLCVAIEQAR